MLQRYQNREDPNSQGRRQRSTGIIDNKQLSLSQFCRSSVYISNNTVLQLVYEKLPNDISERHVLLLDPILGTGSLTLLLCFPLKTNMLSFSGLSGK